jgi:hypothetical protein
VASHRLRGTVAVRRVFEDQQILMLDEPLRVTGGDGVADVLLLEERRPRDEHAVADTADQRDALLDQVQAGVDPSRLHHAGDVDEFAVPPVRAGRDHDVPAGAQQRPAAGEDLSEPVGELVVAAVGTVRCEVGLDDVVLLGDLLACVSDLVEVPVLLEWRDTYQNCARSRLLSLIPGVHVGD